MSQPNYPEPDAIEAQNPLPPLPAVSEKKPRAPLTRRDFIFMGAAFLLSLILVDFGLFHGFHLGFTIAYLLIFAVSSVYLWNKEKTPSVFSLLCGGISVVGSITFALYCNTLVNAFMLLLLVGLFTIYCLGISGSFTHGQGSFRLLLDLAGGTLLAPFKNIGDVVGAGRASLKDGKKNFSGLIGVLIAVPVVFLVLLPLLSSSDAAFEGLLTSIAENIGSYLLELVVACVLFPYAFAYLYGK